MKFSMLAAVLAFLATEVGRPNPELRNDFAFRLQLRVETLHLESMNSETDCTTSKVEHCSGDAQLTRAFCDCGFMGKRLDATCLKLTV